MSALFALSHRDCCTSVSDKNGTADEPRTRTKYGYDTLSRLLSVTHAKGGATLDGATYTVDNAGNRTAKSDLYAGVTTNYGYDNIYELLNATQGGSTTESYTYDFVGNRLTALGSAAWSYNTSNELNSRPGVSYAFDANGNTTTKTDSTGTTNYTWDFENRLASVTLPGSGGTVTFKYDPFGRRIYKSSSSGTSIFTYDNDNLIEETNSAGSAVARYSQGLNIDEPLAMLRSGVTSYYEVDGLSSTTSLSNGAGALAQTYMFDSFGNLTASTGSLTNPFRYTARDFDSETGLQFSRARYYDPQAGRFISEDPMRFDAGINFYRYVKNNATNLADPFGLKVQKCCRTTQINWWADFISMLAGLKHCFIKTDKVTAGMGPANGGALPACPYNTPTKITDQSADAVSPGDCKDVPGVDETCVNNALHIGTPTGKWTVSNQCNSLVNGILEKCSTCTKNSSGFDPLTYGFATH
ncbi:MAG: RHS repeat-associated core domain-containing protein [Candidatus Acidiferrum sp.]